MNYDEARQATGEGGDGKWRWTSANRRTGLTLAFPCTDDCQHVSRVDAERHYYDACLVDAVERDISWTDCSVPDCGEPTNRELGNRPLGLRFSMGVPLCDAHRTLEQLSELHPFVPYLTSVHS